MMKTDNDEVARNKQTNLVLTWLRAAIRISALGVVFCMPNAASAQAYPNGAMTSGVVTQVWTICEMLMFVVQGTLDNGTTGSQAFWIYDTSTPGTGLRAANILAAAAQGKTVSIWNNGTSYSCGGQTGYESLIEISNY